MIASLKVLGDFHVVRLWRETFQQRVCYGLPRHHMLLKGKGRYFYYWLSFFNASVFFPYSKHMRMRPVRDQVFKELSLLD